MGRAVRAGDGLIRETNGATPRPAQKVRQRHDAQWRRNVVVEQQEAATIDAEGARIKQLRTACPHRAVHQTKVACTQGASDYSSWNRQSNPSNAHPMVHCSHPDTT